MKLCQIACFLLLVLVHLIQAQSPAVRFLNTSTSINVEEGSQAILRVSKTGAASSDISIVIKFQDSSTAVGEFMGTSRVLNFYTSEGSSSVKEARFPVIDDSIPEIDETYILVIESLSSNVNIEAPSTAQIVIQANDDANGVIQFEDLSPLVVNEGSTQNSVIIPVLRDRGTFGAVSVTYQIVGVSIVNQDISPSLGVLEFEDGSQSANLTISVLPDDVPEADETFSIILLFANNGARVNQSRSSISLTINENDSPVRFSRSLYTFEEEAKTVSVTVYRGLALDGTRLGPVNSQVTVTYMISASTAEMGSDFFANNGSLTFNPGQTEQQIAIVIFDDDIPELSETVTITLINVGGEAVLDAPTECEVIILANDDQHGVLSLGVEGQRSLPVIVDEDSHTTITDFVILRTGGTFGRVSVGFEIVSESGEEVSSDISPTSGRVTLEDGMTSAVIPFSILSDSSPEEAEVFFLRLINDSVQGGAVVSGVTRGQLIVRDSDFAYGVVQFSSLSDQSISSDSQPRRLQLLLARGGGTIGDLIVNINASYSHSSENDIFMDTFPLATTISSGSSVHVVELRLNVNAFFQIGASFEITIIDVSLIGVSPLVPPSSPTLGARSSINLPVTMDVANGEIGFQVIGAPLVVEEPSGSHVTEVHLNVTREGTSGEAVVYWQVVSVLGSNMDNDFAIVNGSITLPSGVETELISLFILPDDVAETDEEFMVELYSVTPANQRLRQGDTSIKITILENDNPGGFFEFSPETLGPFTLSEGVGVGALVTIIRNGGSLVERSVCYSAEGDDGSQIYGLPGEAIFRPGETSYTVTIAANPDGIPELTETYKLMLTPCGTPQSDVGQRTEIDIVILENDDPYGIIQFPQNGNVVLIGESSADGNITTTFDVIRDQGSFGEVSVSWRISPAISHVDISPTEDVIIFPAGVSRQTLTILSVNDQIPELNETFTITLYNPTGGSRLGFPVRATVIVSANDEGVYIEEMASCAVESSEIVLRVIRNGTATSAASVRYRTIQGSAIQSADFVAAQGVIAFDVGVTMTTIVIQILDDSEPEVTEFFEVELYESVGDIVIIDNPRTSVQICSNDVPGGMFSFRPPGQREIQEGETIDIIIQRAGGTFGSLKVYWLLFHADTRQRVRGGQEFEQVEGYVQFIDGQTTGVMTLEATVDGIPEFEEEFFLTLLNITVDNLNLDARLDVTDITAIKFLNITVGPNDDPYGVLDFANAEQEVAEDFLPGEEAKASVNVTIERHQGLEGSVSVIWEILSNSVAAGWPTVVDLMFVSKLEDNLEVSPAPSERRPSTGTMPYLFTGTGGSFITVPSEVDFSVLESDNGFSISAWVKPALDCNGLIVSKVDAQSPIRMLYGLKLDMNPQSAYLEFRHSTGSATNLAPGFTLGFSTVPLNNGEWHHLCVTADVELISFYVDGELRSSSSLSQGPVTDGNGVIYVGGLFRNQEHYKGFLQDVRFYDRMLLPREVAEIWNLPAQTDITPISGIVTFDTGQSENSLQISSKQDDDPEGNELYQVLLITAEGGVRLESDSRTLVAVLKSDNANGLFGFDGPCLSTGSGAENLTFSCLVQRTRGDTGTVRLPWEIRNQETGDIASNDFVNATGEVVFGENVREMTIRLMVVDDDLPELREQFDLILLENLPLSDDGLIGSTNTSGASIKPDASINTISIEQSDNPYGLFQFSLGTPPGLADPLIDPAPSQIDLSIPEDVGIARLLVVRAQGLLGDITLEWRTIDGTAVSAGKNPIDFMSGGGTVEFSDGQRFANIDITVQDNTIPELEKKFQVELSNPTGGAALGPGSVVEVTIESSDNAYGIFQISNSSLVISVDEGEGGGSSVQLQVVRSGGDLGEVTIYWMVAADASSFEADPISDIINPTGNVTFNVGQRTAIIVVEVASDEIPELDENFSVELISSDTGSIGPQNISRLTILANDDPYGVFVFSADTATVRTPERNRTITLQISRERGSKGTVQVTYASLSAVELLPGMPPFTSRAEEQLDFIPVRNSLTFNPGQLNASFQVMILNDNLPESEESVFIAINGVNLLGSDQIRPVAGSPRLGDPSIAEIEILANDNANGVLQLSSDRVVVSEDSVQPVINVTRTAGTFGTVTVKFQTIPESALSNVDFSVTSTDVILYNGETSKQLPIEVINDRIPELEETFRVRLLDQITGGAILGSPVEAEILIQSSDDPNGNFGFGTSSQTVIEPDEGEERQLVFNLVRSGGSLGVVAIQWEATLNGFLATEDVFPTGGTLHFLSGDVTDSFTIDILPDEVPEEREDIVVSLVSANGGGVIGDQASITITIEANDAPHGVVEFASENNNVMEVEGMDRPAAIRVIRRGGVFGELEVTFNTQQTDLIQESLKQESSVLEMYQIPVSGSLLGVTMNSFDVSRSATPLITCAERCLEERACGAFEFQQLNVTALCMWSVTQGEENIDQQSGFQLYRKNLEKTQLLYESQAVSGSDYAHITSGTLTIPDGQNQSLAFVTILDDILPERDEVFLMTLDSVRVVSSNPLPTNRPVIGALSVTRVTILNNDDANGIWAIYSNSPNAMGDNLVLVQERAGLSVSEELIIERRGGTIGEVSVSWRVSYSTADAGLDYTASGGSVNFGPGQTRQVINIGIKDDNIPENDELLTIEIYNPTGGSILSDQNNVTVVILANDNVAGVVGFSQLSHIVNEGETFNVTVERTLPAIGTVMVSWDLSGSNGYLPGLSFLETNGSLLFSEGELVQVISLAVLSDETPESNEEFLLTLSDINTQGVSPSGAAILEPRTSMASVTIQASDEPHGVFSFAQGSLSVSATEGNTTIQLFVERKFGAIGVVQVGYNIYEITSEVGVSPRPQISAMEGQDFMGETGVIEFTDGESITAINVEILEDNIPELDEVFYVDLTSVQLVSPASTSFPPKLGSLDTTSEVTITANDGTQGIVGFNLSSDGLSVLENVTIIRVGILRDRGTYGEVTVFLYSQPVEARKEIDYLIDDQVLVFADGEFMKEVTIQILEDDLPEDSESFELILNNPTGGLQLGQLTRVTIRILPNDNAFGIISFTDPFLQTIAEPDDSSQTTSLAQFTLIREKGAFGQVEVPFSVEGADGDLTPMNGFVTFEPEESFAVLQISAVADKEPELREQFTVVLGIPTGGAFLGAETNVTIIIEDSDAPYGLLQIYPLDSRNDSIEVEEDSDVVYYVVERSGGQIETVSVDVTTQPGTAVSPVGPEFHLGILQSLNISSASDYHSFEYDNEVYLVVLSSEVKGPLMSSIGSDGAVVDDESEGSVSGLFRWQGIFVPVQTIETDGARSCASHMIGGAVYIAIANQGSPGQRESSTRIYGLQNDGSLMVIQDIPTTGASGVTFLNRGSDVYLLIGQQFDTLEGSNTNSLLYIWSGMEFVFSGVTPTTGAAAVESFEIDNNQYVAIASYYNTQTARYNIRSKIYRWQNGILSIYQELDTMGATDLEAVTIGTNNFLVIANGRNDEDTDVVNSVIYRWNPQVELFENHQFVPTTDCGSVTSFTTANGITYLVFANSADQSMIFMWNSFSAMFEMTSTYRDLNQVESLKITDSRGRETVMLVTSTVGGDQSETRILEMTSVSDEADFIPWSRTLSFAPTDTHLVVGLTLLPDDRPEDDESFMVTLTNPTNGAMIGPSDEVTTIIISNDDAHGIVGFAQESLQMYVEEEASDTPVVLTVERQRGSAGLVVVAWEASGGLDTTDLRPSRGQIEFLDGITTSAIVMTIIGDSDPELDETSFIQLTEIVNPGTSREGRGAVIGSEDNTAQLTVIANDSPHGVFGWSIDSLYAITDEPEGSQASRVVTLFITREQGRRGTVNVYYSTFQSSSLPEIEQAVSDRDFVARSNNYVSFSDGADTASVEVTILPDTAAEGPETFFVNLTSVELISSAPQGGAAPSVKSGQNVAEITIRQNDNANGILQFTADKNENGEVEVYEGSGTDGFLHLKVTRSAGAIGIVGFGWTAASISATSADFSPMTGNITMATGQREAIIDISIVDDEIEEEAEKFTVSIDRPTGGAVLGEELTVLVKILKNDSPRGLFGFSYDQQSVAEGGLASFVVERTQGSVGRVTIEWELEIAGRQDLSPVQGTLLFQGGTLRETIRLEAILDNVLEGEERFTISISSPEDVEISPVRDQATVIIQPDPGSSGVVSVLPGSRNILIGEPTPSHDGTAMIHLTRGVGIFGEVVITWQISPTDLNTFINISGSITFVEGQQNATIIIQTVDDSVPELKKDFSLLLASITGGASIDTGGGANQATITVVASDNPFGIFEFQEPPQVTVNEDIGQVNVVVVRQAGIYGRVQVAYSTISQTAVASEDYLEKIGVIEFPEGVDIQTISVTIIPDSLPEGPESLLINLTSVTLLSTSGVSFSDQNGLQLDMRPQLGSLTMKEVTIDKNDNAEGIIEFTDSLLEVPEDIGTVTIPVVRGSGTFGRVSAFYSVQNVTAIPDGVDYILTDGEVIFLDGQSLAYISATIINDQIKEFSETFTVTLVDTQGGAILGSNTTEVIAISKSDGPDGLIGFAASDLNRIIPNPENPRDLSFSIELSGGTDEYLTGTEVRWRILGPNSEDVLMETDDIATPDSRLQGSVTFDPQTRGVLSFTLQVRPYFGPEVQEIYKVDIYQVVGAGEVIRDRKSAKLTILKHGDPNGIIQFDEASLQPRSFAEPNDDSSPTSVSFRVERKEGAVGDVQVYWEVRDMKNSMVTTDINPTNGTLDFSSGTASGDIRLSILPDSEPELEESFQLVLVSSQGGADINPQFNVSRFSIRPNDDPHGVFSILDEDQMVFVDDDLNRFLRIQILREGGTLGSVQVNFGLRYNDGVTGAYVPIRGTMTCGEGEATCSKDVEFLNNDVFLERGTTFTINLTSVSYIGSDVTIAPIIDPGRSSAVLRVTQAVANSQVGFLLSDIEISEDNYQVMLTVNRIGAYGDVDVNWEAGYPTGSVPSGFTEGIITPRSGQVRFTNGQGRRTVTIGLTPLAIQEVFALHISSVQSPSGVGVRLDEDRAIVEIAPSGLISFAQPSRDVQAQESEGEVILTIQRQLGAQGLIRVNYQTTSGSAIAGEDYNEISGGAVTLSDGQQSETIIVKLLAENIPELAKTFYVNITSVQRLDNNQAPGPLLSTLYSVAMVTIEANNDPFGVFSISPVLVETTESEGTCKLVELTIARSGGLFGDVSLMVRTVGGGELWENDIISQSTNDTNTIGFALVTSQGKLKASAGSDYEELQETLIFRANQDTDVVRLSVCDDNNPEPDEHFYVYVTVMSGGARVAGPGDGGLQGYAEVIILGNDNYNGIIGFSDDSLYVSVSEDVNPTVTLILDRGDAFFDGVVVEWRATYSLSGDVSQDAELSNQLVETEGSRLCSPQMQMCELPVTLINDQEPEFTKSFAVELLGVGQGASLNPARRYANITMEDSDYPYGRLGFTLTTRIQSIDRLALTVTLTVERFGGRSTDSTVSWETSAIESPEKLGGVTTFPALAGPDFMTASGTLNFPPTLRRQNIQINLPAKDDNAVYDPEEYPKQFKVRLFAATNGASVDGDSGTASIVISEDDLSATLWDQYLVTDFLVDNTETTIENALIEMSRLIQTTERLTQDQLLLILATLDNVITEGYNRRFSTRLQTQILDIFCELMDPSREDTRGFYEIAETFVRFSYILVTGLPCSSDSSRSMECSFARVEAARWPRETINNHRFQGSSENYFSLPSDLLNTEGGRGSSCEDIHFIEYNSQQWFSNSNSQPVLNAQVISVGIKGAETNFTNLASPVEYRIYTSDARVTPRGAECVIFSPGSERWLKSSCEAVSDQFNYVQCECYHLSEFAVEAETDNLVGYNIFVYISCFVVMGCFFLAIVTHHVCAVYSMFAARLLMHMCVAAMCLQIMFVTSAYVSNWVSPQGCTALAVLIHYFFLSQFSWMFIQGLNFWKVFVMNDEHTARYYIIFFVTGWTLPVIVIVFYVIIMYAAFDWPLVYDSSLVGLDYSQVIYGDVHGNGDLCFIPNGYAALASVGGPAIVALVAVLIVFMQAFQVKPQWKRYDDIYMGRYNTTEVKLIFLFWVLICITWLFGGLHLAFSQLWLLILFVIFNFIQGFYAFLVYTVLRNQLCKPSKGNYSLNNQLGNNVTLLENNRYNSHSNLVILQPDKSSMKGTLTKAEAKNLAVYNNPVIQTEWETESLGQRSHHSMNVNQMVKPPSIHGSNLYAPAPFHEPQPTIEDDDNDSQEFDDLIFALKTGGALPINDSASSAGSKNVSGWQDQSRTTSQSRLPDTTADSVDHYELRKVAIADTHL